MLSLRIQPNRTKVFIHRIVMSLIPIIVVAIVVLSAAYVLYGGFISRKLGINDENITPAHKLRDDIDYMPTKTPVVLGHHFASIAGAGPIVGPIIAVAFGWIPALIWILVGGIFFGAVHDLTSMMASIRHQGKSIGEVIERYIGISGKKLVHGVRIRHTDPDHRRVYGHRCQNLCERPFSRQCFGHVHGAGPWSSAW